MLDHDDAHIGVSLPVDRLQVLSFKLSQLGSTTGAWEASTILNNTRHDLEHTSTPPHEHVRREVQPISKIYPWKFDLRTESLMWTHR